MTRNGFTLNVRPDFTVLWVLEYTDHLCYEMRIQPPRRIAQPGGTCHGHFTLFRLEPEVPPLMGRNNVTSLNCNRIIRRRLSQRHR